MARGFKTIHTSPLEGFLDTRSTPDDVPFGSYRWILNWELTHTKRLCRATGWQKLLSQDTGYNNQDLHDQLGYTRQHLTLLYQAKSPAGFSKLFAATQNRIYAMTPELDNWRVLSDLLGGTAQTGCPERRWTAGHVNDTVVFTNNYDAPVYHLIDQPPLGANNQSVETIRDFETLNITRVGVVAGWNGLMFYGNLVEDGVRAGNVIIWSDMNRPLSVIPNPNVSLAGRVELDTEELVLAILPLIDRLLVYTNRGIWEGVAVGGSQVMLFARRFKAPKENIRCLAYPNTLVSTGAEHYYWGLDGIYKYSLYDPQPVLVEWIHRATSYVFENLNKSRCHAHVGGYYEQKKTIYWSWAKVGEECPSEAIAVNTEHPVASYLDHGFSCFCNSEPDAVKSLRTWLQELCVCSGAELETYGGGLVKEGGRYCLDETTYTCATTPTSLYSDEALTDGDVTTENYSGAASATSLFTLLGNATLESLCGEEMDADQCNAEQLFIGVSAVDQCIKEFANVYYREMLASQTLCVAGDTSKGYNGTYEQRGYRSRLLSGAIHFKEPDHDKQMTRFAMEAHPLVAVRPSLLNLKIGIASHAVDPLTATVNCVIMWEEQDTKELECLGDASADQHEVDGTRPNDEMEWGLFQTGRYLYFDIEITNPNVVPVDTGGGVCLSRLSFDVGLEERRLR